jgi:hypothetical protein
LTPTNSESGQISVSKTLCDQIGQQGTCSGRDTSLSDYHIDFEIHQGTGDAGVVVGTVTVTLNENAQGQANAGNGSQGSAQSTPLAAGTYTVCEIELAYRDGYPAEPLQATPRPNAGGGGSSGGNNQELFGTNCIVVTLTNGGADLKFLDVRL